MSRLVVSNFDKKIQDWSKSPKNFQVLYNSVVIISFVNLSLIIHDFFKKKMVCFYWITYTCPFNLHFVSLSKTLILSVSVKLIVTRTSNGYGFLASALLHFQRGKTISQFLFNLKSSIWANFSIFTLIFP